VVLARLEHRLKGITLGLPANLFDGLELTDKYSLPFGCAFPPLTVSFAERKQKLVEYRK